MDSAQLQQGIAAKFGSGSDRSSFAVLVSANAPLK